MRRPDGFTLLEMLAAVAVLAIVLALAFEMFRNITGVREDLVDTKSRSRSALVILDRLESELVGAIILRRREGVDPLVHPWVFYGRDDTLDGNDADQLHFVTQTPLRAPGERIGRGLRLVTYGVEPGADGIGQLMRHEQPLPDRLIKDIDLSEAQVVADAIHSFTLRYEGGDGSRWDSTSIEQADQTPQSVDVGVVLWERDGDGQLVPGEKFTRVVALPVRPEFLEAKAGQRGGNCETGISVAECRDLWRGAIAEFGSDEDIEFFMGAFDKVEEPCWNPPQPSRELRDLWEVLRQYQTLAKTVDVPECPHADSRPGRNN